MNLSVGIIGLPNVGKSTLFNALLKKQAALAANYPFATIEPNVGIVPVPDGRLNTLAEITKTEEGMTELPPLKPATIEFVDIAGLVKGASEGAGLGNKFLSHIREVKVIAHVVRDFEDSNIIREGSVDAKTDYETILTELILADLQTLGGVNEKALRMDPVMRTAVEKLNKELDTGKGAYDVELTEKEEESIRDLQLLSKKPEIIAINVAEGEYTDAKIPVIVKKFSDVLGISQDHFVVICAKVESELSELDEAEQAEYLKELGVEISGLARLTQIAYDRLGLISFLTAGAKEVRAWTIRKGATAVEAAGEIHTDFMAKFIKAEVVGYNDFVECAGWKGAREKGRAGLQGKEYVMQDGDVVEFKIGR